MSTHYNLRTAKTYSPDFVEVVTPPDANVVSLEDFKEHLSGDAPESDLFLQSKINVATTYVEEMLKMWLRQVTLKAVSQRIPQQLFLPGGRVLFTTITARLSGLENHELTTYYAFSDQHDTVFYLTDCPDFTVNQTRLEVQYTIHPYATPEPIKEAIMKAATHLYDVRGTNVDAMKDAKYEIKSLIKPWIRHSKFKKVDIR